MEFSKKITLTPPRRSKVAITARENAKSKHLIGLYGVSIKNLWAEMSEMKMMVRRHTPPPSSIKVLENYVKDASLRNIIKN